MLSGYSKILNYVISSPKMPIEDSEIAITSFSFAEGLTRDLREKNNFSKEECDKIGLLFAIKLYTTSLTIGIPKNSYNLRVEQVLYSSNAIIQYFKELETLLNIMPIYFTNIISVTNDVIQGVKDQSFFKNTIYKFIEFNNSLQYYIKIIKIEQQYIPKEYGIPELESQFQLFFKKVFNSLQNIDKYRGLKEANFPVDQIKQQEAIYVNEIKEILEFIAQTKTMFFNIKKKILDNFDSLFDEQSYSQSIEYFTKFINTISSITMFSYEIIQNDPVEFFNGITNLQNIINETFKMVTSYYMVMRSHKNLDKYKEESKKAHDILGPQVDSLSALISRTIPKCPPFLHEYFRKKFFELFTEIQHLYVDFDKQTQLISYIIENGFLPQNQPQIQKQSQSQPSIKIQNQSQTLNQLQNQLQTSIQIQSQSQPLNQIQSQSQQKIIESQLNEKVLKLQEENELLKKESENIKKELEIVKNANSSLLEKLDNSGSTSIVKKQVVKSNSSMIKSVSIDEIDDLKNKTLIGQGGQSRVYRVSKDTFFALKELEVTNSPSDNYKHLQRLLQEYEIINSLSHPNIIKTFGICFGDETHPPSIILEFCPFSLHKCVKDLQDCEKISAIFEICLAMCEVHDKHLIHRDLKPENILMDDEKHVKVSDFGISRLNEIEGEQSKTLGIGTLKFMAPEILNEDKFYNEKVDVYSFGVIMFFILTNGQYPKISITEIALGKKAPIPSNVNKISGELILRCWSMKSEDRPSFNEIVEYIKNNNFTLIDGIEYQIPKIKEFLSL